MRKIGIASIIIWLLWFWAGLVVMIGGHVTRFTYFVLWMWALFQYALWIMETSKNDKEDNEDE